MDVQQKFDKSPISVQQCGGQRLQRRTLLSDHELYNDGGQQHDEHPLQLAMLQSPMCSDGVTKKFIFLLDSVRFKTSCVFTCMRERQIERKRKP